MFTIFRKQVKCQTNEEITMLGVHVVKDSLFFVPYGVVSSHGLTALADYASAKLTDGPGIIAAMHAMRESKVTDYDQRILIKKLAKEFTPLPKGKRWTLMLQQQQIIMHWKAGKGLTIESVNSTRSRPKYQTYNLGLNHTDKKLLETIFEAINFSGIE